MNSEEFATRIRAALGPLNDESKPVVIVVEEVAKELVAARASLASSAASDGAKPAPDATRRDERSQPAVGLPRPGEAVSELAAYKSALDDLFMAAEDMHDAWEKMLKAAASVKPIKPREPLAPAKENP